MSASGQKRTCAVQKAVQLGMSALGHKRTLCDAEAMSALPLKADTANQSLNNPLSNIFLPSLTSIGPSHMSARRLRVKKRAEHRGPASLEILLLLQSTLQRALIRFCDSGHISAV